MEIPLKYDSKKIEQKWYEYWLKNNFFQSKPDSREPYTIIMPPPNVTGVLHMGHMLNNTIQDVLIRRQRLKGKNTCWVPGTDHASIATEAKVVAMLEDMGIDKNNISREEFIEHAWTWTNEYGNIILNQLKKLGCSCDWNRTKFTLDSEMTESVVQVFIDLFNKGLIYKGFRAVNWDPKAKTTLSDEEVIFKEIQGNLYHIKYKIKDSDDFIVVATTRPETIFGDSAICVNPNDDRYKKLIGKEIIVPICDRAVPVIVDEYVDIDFGTGCLKVTPAHDFNDKILGDKHNLEVHDIFNLDATLNELGLEFEGLDRFAARKEVLKKLKSNGQLVKVEDHIHNVGFSERTKVIIEPRLSYQWFLKMSDLVKPALDDVVNSNRIKLFPKKFINTYRHWLDNIRDWNISRQLYWGHRIPVYYYGDGKNDFVVAKNAEEAIKLVQKKTRNEELRIENLRQDPDVLDTWFSSWLWPISVFDGIRNPNNDEIKYYYPTSDLITGPDILFFWVARMIIAGHAFRNQKPFENVYLTGLVRDKNRIKMSKSLGNSPDPLRLIGDYGADGVRVGLLLSSSAGNDLLFDESLCQQGKGFGNKIWNAFRLVKGFKVIDKPQPEYASLAIDWYKNKFQNVLAEIEENFEKYRLNDAMMSVYKLIWFDYCSWFLEMVKPKYGSSIDKSSYDSLINLFEQNLKLLHPFMPFLTEEIWNLLRPRKVSESLTISKWPVLKSFDIPLLQNFEFFKDVITGIRNFRKTNNISLKVSVELFVVDNEKKHKEGYDQVIKKLCNINTINYIKSHTSEAFSFRIGSNEYFVVSKAKIDKTSQIKKISEELNYLKGLLKKIQKKLRNEDFISNAPNHVIDFERKKKHDVLAKIEILELSLKKFS